MVASDRVQTRRDPTQSLKNQTPTQQIAAPRKRQLLLARLAPVARRGAGAGPSFAGGGRRDTRSCQRPAKSHVHSEAKAAAMVAAEYRRTSTGNRGPPTQSSVGLKTWQLFAADVRVRPPAEPASRT